MLTLLIIIILIQLFNTNLLSKLKKQNKMNKEELLVALSDIGAQLNKGIAEVIAAMQNAGNVPQEVVDKVTELKNIAQQLDDLNPDAPTP